LADGLLEVGDEEWGDCDAVGWREGSVVVVEPGNDGEEEAGSVAWGTSTEE
jgi:hypothetical protein